ncbi:UNVERIFIED_CONTAM: Prohibitin-3, mitochondrial [Sesamum radiatum]|uniref:Prohibitin n=1 Tax=Sesamum radiatum TaxID=300843 RepID=A0AAW2V9C6_SESRA
MLEEKNKIKQWPLKHRVHNKNINQIESEIQKTVELFLQLLKLQEDIGLAAVGFQFGLRTWAVKEYELNQLDIYFKRWLSVNLHLQAPFQDQNQSKTPENGSSQARSFLTNIARAAFSVGIGATVLNASLYTVDGGQRAVLFDRFRGVIEDTVGEGTHFLIPWLQKPFIFDIRTRPHTFSSVSGTKDLQMVNLTLRVLSRPEVNRLPDIFKTLGLEYDEKVLPSIGNEVLKAVVAQFNADQLLTERPHVSALVRESLIRRAKDFNIVLDDVAITHLSYEQERRAAIIRAEGESESAKLISDATAAAGMGLIELRKIEAAKENATSMCRNGNVVYLPSNNNMLLGVNPGR